MHRFFYSLDVGLVNSMFNTTCKSQLCQIHDDEGHANQTAFIEDVDVTTR